MVTSRTMLVCFAATVAAVLFIHRSDAAICYQYADCIEDIIVKKGKRVTATDCCSLGGAYKMGKRSKCTNCDGATPPPYFWSQWTEWSSCCYQQSYDSRYAEGRQGEKIRHRDCVLGKCVGQTSERKTVRKCVPVGNGDGSGSGYCAIHGQWGDWTDYGPCDALVTKCSPDGNVAKTQKGVHGLAKRTRSCDNPTPRHGGAYCAGPSESSQKCLVAHCPVNGAYCSWREWSPCTKNCTVYGSQPDGTRKRHRSCSCPAPEHGGQQCDGPTKENGLCGDDEYCPKDGVWSEWDEWSDCDKKCGIGEKFRTRSCSPPQFGGALCPGYSREYVLCQEKECPSICEMAGSGYSGSASGDVYSGSGDYEPDYNICCPPTFVYVEDYGDCCRENITDDIPSGSGMGSSMTDGDGSAPRSLHGSAAGSAAGSASGSASGSGILSGSGPDFYYDCFPQGGSNDGGNSGDVPSGSGGSGTSASGLGSGGSGRAKDKVAKRKRRSTSHRHRRSHRRSKNEDYVYFDMEHGGDLE